MYQNVGRSILTDKPAASADVSTAFVFPDHPTRRFVIGQPVQVLVGLKNLGSSTLNVTTIAGAFNSPVDVRQFVQNFTEQGVNVTVAPESAMTFAYTFAPDPRHEPVKLLFAASIFYQDAETGQKYSSTFFNSTVELIEPPASVDTKTIFSWVGLTSVVAIVALIAIKVSSGNEEKGKREEENDWLKLVPKKKTSKAGPGKL